MGGREGGDDIEWVGKALRAVGAEGGGHTWVVGSVGGGGGVLV